MLDFDPDQRRMLMNKLPDAANLAVGALVFGQFIGARPVSWGLIAVGLWTWAALIGLALVIGRRH